MAQNTFINVVLNANAASIPDLADHVHTVAGGTAAANDVTLSFDSAKVTKLSVADSAYAAVRKRLAAGGLK